MTSFKAGDPGTQDQPTQTTQTQGGGVDTVASDTEDKTVILEHDGRQFTKADLVKKITNADTHISTLTQELRDQREQLGQVAETLKKQVGMAELLKQIKEGQPVAPEAPATPQTVDPDAITAAVLGRIEESRAAQQRDTNWQQVTTTLTQQFGEQVDAKVAAVAKEVGMSLAEAVELAKSKPQAFLRLFPQPENPKTTGIGQRGQMNSQAVVAANHGQPRAESGFSKTRNVREQITIYHNRLRELGLSV